MGIGCHCWIYGTVFDFSCATMDNKEIPHRIQQERWIKDNGRKVMLAIAIILVLFLGISVVVLTGALCALCLGIYDEIYGDLEEEQGD